MPPNPRSLPGKACGQTQPHAHQRPCAVQLLVAPLRKLTNKANASIDQIAPNPSSLVGSIGPYVTGAPLQGGGVRVSVSAILNPEC